jgi:O-antigen ligase
MRTERINHDINIARDVAERVLFILLLASTLLTLVKMPYIKYGVHNVFIPLFALMMIGLRFNSIKEVFANHRSAFMFMGLLYGWMWISAFQSEFQNTAIKYSIKYSYYPLLFSAFLFLTYKQKNIYIYYRLLFYFLLLLSMFGIVEEFYPEISIFHLIRPFGSYMPRVSSLMQNPNPFGSLMSLGVIVVILLRNDRAISRVELFMGSILFTLNAFLSGSRNAVIILMCGVVVFLAYQKISLKKNNIIWIVSFVCGSLLFLIIFYIFYHDQVTYIVYHYLHGEGSTRFVIWRRALYEFAHHPFSGIGIQVFSKHIGIQVLGSDVFHTHNIMLNILVELGAVGLFLSLLFAYNLLKGLNYKDPRITIPIIIILASQMFDYYLHDVTYAAISFYFLALAANSKNEHFHKPDLAV